MNLTNDFGFTFDDSDETAVQTATSKVDQLSKQIEAHEATIANLRQLNREMYKKFYALLSHLKQSPEKPMIKWPNRKEAIDKMIEDLQALKADKEQK